jgi:zona occludens toxin
VALNLYSGNPGSGKTQHLAITCMKYLYQGKSVISNNSPVDPVLLRYKRRTFFGKLFRKKEPDFIFKSYKDLTVNFLVNYAFKNHKKGRENQTLLAIDEAQVLFNARDYNKPDRQDWVNFFMEHRKIGYEIIFVSQNIRLIDKQIRGIIEDEYRHKEVNKFLWILPVKVFAVVKYSHSFKQRFGLEFFMFSKSAADFFDSYKLLGSLDSVHLDDTASREGW